MFFGVQANQEKEMVKENNAFMDDQSGNFGLLPIPEAITPNNIQHVPSKVTQNLEDVDTLVQCIVIHGVAQDAVCRECLAMYSKGFAIRTYHLTHKSKYSGELCVFPTDHKQRIILGNCENTFFHHIFPLKRSKCEIIHRKLPNDLAVPRKEDMVHESSAKSVQYKNPSKGKDIGRIMEHIALKRMTRSRDNRQFQSAKLRSQETIDGLVNKASSCINFVARLSNRWICIGCILEKL